ncbi:hypothetical protein P152DRAFT_476138 [Eremomyces bilateralis CBS 781.70]|uniref:Zn(2)-C6 fungal-type domain-containing protein n=1 Tax=Eremomyces bilateralis CBS 781.70 TaxID=1392243 RepID=A0A6G1FV71_9PEZI|nr:uncharacterized protein P152DRAFT_476138 [Eremomyces bilateralis CBS 781.70]KAF1809717.1 hypothetical protein P152DRAFT_476138 [Eremomyces bilateralis CBS 781.70]
MSSAPEAKSSSTRPRLKRVLRACDNCRIRKAKCDGQLPCAACNLHQLECSFDSPRVSKRRDLKYIQELERTVERLTALVRVVSPHVDLEKAIADDELSSDILELVRPGKRVKSEGPERSAQSFGSNAVPPNTFLETMVDGTGHLNIDDSGNCDYNGNFAGLILLQRIRERCNDLISEGTGVSDVLIDDDGSPIPQPFQPFASPSPANPPEPKTHVLPPMKRAEKLVDIAFECAFPLLQFIHRPTFQNQFEEYYPVENSNVEGNEPRFLALLLGVLAVGELFSADVVEPGSGKGHVQTSQAELYYRAGQSLIDVTDIRDIMSLQALVCFVIYLQSSAMISHCYTHICIALSSATRMGLHRSATSQRFGSIDREVRKRIFWVIRTMDTYVTTILGLPRTLNDDDIDQELPGNVDDEFLTESGAIQPMQDHPRFSSMTALNAHVRLLRIMSRVVKTVHSGHRPQAAAMQAVPGPGPYKVDYAKIVAVEAELDAWFSELPSYPCGALQDVPIEHVKQQLLLRLAYAHVQMVLYRPFLHHISKSRNDPNFDLRAFACASACTKAAMQAIWLVQALEDRKLLVGCYWFTVYITFFAVACLLMFVLTNGHDPSAKDTFDFAERGRNILVKMKGGCGLTASRCVECLEPIFAKIPETGFVPRDSSASNAFEFETMPPSIAPGASSTILMPRPLNFIPFRPNPEPSDPNFPSNTFHQHHPAPSTSLSHLLHERSNMAFQQTAGRSSMPAVSSSFMDMPSNQLDTLMAEPPLHGNMTAGFSDFGHNLGDFHGQDGTSANHPLRGAAPAASDLDARVYAPVYPYPEFVDWEMFVDRP